GVILDNADQFQNIPPDEIVSYAVLKDAASTAIYGLRGANGVIIVTTKKGEKGHPTTSYDGLLGAASQSKYYDLLSAPQYLNAVSQIQNVDASIYNKNANTDWQKAIGRTAIQQRNSLSVSGGSDMFTYLGGVDYQNQPGIIQNSGKDQLGLRFNAELKAFADKLDVKAGIQYVNTTRKFADYSIFSYVPNAPPTYPVKNPDGSYFEFSNFNEENPVEHLNQEVLSGKENLTLINGSADYSIIHDLKIGLAGSADLNKIQSAGYIPHFADMGNLSESSQSNENTHLYNGNVYISYDKTFGKSTLDLLGAYEYNDYYYDSDYAKVAATNPPGGPSGTFKDEYKLRSLIARAAYSYDDRFYATASLREDGSTTFAPGEHAYFPSFSLAYRFKKDLLANVDWISDIKLHAGYGVTGNSIDQYGNPTPKWQEIHGSDIGLGFSLLNGRLSGDLNYFNNETSNALVLVSLPSPPFTGGILPANIGSLTNKGLEISLSGRIISGNKLNWTAYGQITFITTTIDNLSGQYTYNGQTYPISASQIPIDYAEGRGLSSNPIQFLKDGYSPYVFYLPHYTGVDAQGNQTFDGQSIAQNSNPAGHYIDPSAKFNYGITNAFDYGNWNLSFALRGV
ncbi:MAG TPA: TonB-dependent receptor, partial [Mucilaginibacter sp.]|nr:TonB-dependent receptor [Mucilaginibacter sp.]